MAEEGEKVVIKGVYEGFPDPNVLWLHNQTPVRPSHDIKIEVRNKETSISFTKVSILIFAVIIKLRQRIWKSLKLEFWLYKYNELLSDQISTQRPIHMHFE